MSFALAAEEGIDIPANNYEYKDTYEKAKVACATALKLHEMGMPIEIDEEDELFAEKIIKEEVKPSTKEIFKPGVAIKLGAILTEYDIKVAKDAAQLRTVATNKLIEMLDDPDPKVRLKAVEMIGKIADVGLFAERTEITITTKSTEELEKELVGLFKDYIDVEAKEKDEPINIQKLMSYNVEDGEEIKEDGEEIKEDAEEVKEDAEEVKEEENK